MANVKITELTALTDPASTDVLPIVDVVADITKKISIADLLENAGSGTAAAPGIAFDGDSNTGIYRPGADQLAISTNGTGRLFIDANGNVGVGASSITNLANYAQLVLNDSNGGFIDIEDDGVTQARIIGSGTELTLRAAGTGGSISFDTNGNNERLRIESTGELKHIGGGASGSPAVGFNGSAPSNSLVIDSTGKVGVGTSSPSELLHVQTGNFGSVQIGADGPSQFASKIFNPVSTIKLESTASDLILSSARHFIFQDETGSQIGRWDANGRLGIGTTSPSNKLVASNSGAEGVEFAPGYSSNLNRIQHYNRSSSSYIDSVHIANSHQFWKANTTEAARIDSSGRLLVGTSTAASTQDGNLQVDTSACIRRNVTSSGGPAFRFEKTRASSDGTYSVVQAGDSLGELQYYGADGTKLVQAASITAEVDGTPGVDDMPGRLLFSTTADGASSPTEAMRITNERRILMQKTSVGIFNEGLEFYPGLGLGVTNNQNPVLRINRLGTDGNLVDFYQDTALEGSISVSGTTVSYNGAHLSRWSQLPGGAERTKILRGTVLSNIDEMCAWGEEDNEQLNRMKVSDVEGDRNVAGVFQGWDDDDDTYTDDFYCAMTGDFVIRIAKGVTVERGDLLMSAGDGTAKPQDDDIIRSKTIAKVTSTHVSETYDDGSYCVPCVLMAC